jgi:hypothetical protein
MALKKFTGYHESYVLLSDGIDRSYIPDNRKYATLAHASAYRKACN